MRRTINKPQRMKVGKEVVVRSGDVSEVSAMSGSWSERLEIERRKGGTAC
jgi:hypothetical protein